MLFQPSVLNIFMEELLYLLSPTSPLFPQSPVRLGYLLSAHLAVPELLLWRIPPNFQCLLKLKICFLHY